MLIVYKSNKLDTLLLKAYKIIKTKPLNNIFEKEIFIHDNKILFQYLNIFFANQTGISSNLKCYYPYNFIWNLFQKIYVNKNFENIFTPSVMTWNIMNILDEKKICKYINIEEKILKKFKFSYLMAHIFEKYLLYRPNWICEWEKGKYTQKIHSDDRWQIKLWKEIIKNYKNINPLNNHFSNLFYDLRSLINKNKINKNCFPNRCFIISFNQLNPIFIKIFKKISVYSNIYFLQITYSKKNIFQNSLMKLWGKQELLNKLYWSNSNKIKIINCFKQNKYNNLLNSIQTDLLEDKCFKQKRLIKLTDNSISVHICYSKQNEIEILYKILLLLLQKNSNLTLNDIVVTSFSVEDYITSINLIFTSFDNKKKIPFFISKKLCKKTERIFSVFNNLLNLSNSRFENEEILKLFDIPEIASKFDISKEEVDILYYWVEKVNIRWAIDGNHKKQFSLPKNEQNTWFYGIEKLLLSYAMNNTKNVWNNILSSTLINGSHSDLIGKLIIFINVLKKWKKKLLKSQYLKDWRTLSKNLFNDFFLENEKINNSINMIHKKWINMIDDALIVNYRKKVSIEILKKKFIIDNNDTYKKNFLPGAINFCHPSDISFMPFKVIFFIGADHKNIPKKNNLDAFNLLNKYPLINDIDTYQKHSYFFLQNIFSAEKYFYISYVGYSIKDNSKVYPSIFIDQLLSYISRHFSLVGDKNLTINENINKITKHLCKKYTKEHFYKKKNIHNLSIEHSDNTLKNISIKTYKPVILEKKCFNKINLQDLICFWKNPIRYFYQYCLKIKFDLKIRKINNTEPFTVNPFDALEIKKNLLNKIIKNEDTYEIFQYYLLSGKLPYNFFGTIFWNEKVEEMQSISKLVKQYRICTEEKKINIRITKYKIIGLLSEIQNTGLLRWKPNAINYSDRMSLWIEHLIYSIIGGVGESKFIGYKNQIWSYIHLTPTVAYDYLLQYIEGYIEGSKKILLLTKSGASWIDQIYNVKNHTIKNDDDSIKKGHKKLFDTWIGNNYIKGEKEDLYIQNILPVLNKENIKKICQIAQIWLTPLLKNKKIKT